MTQLIQLLFGSSVSSFNKHRGIENWLRFFNKRQLFLLLLTVISCNSIREKNKWKYMPFSNTVVQINLVNDPIASYYVSLSDDMYDDHPNILELKQRGEYFLPMEIDMPGKVPFYFGEQTYNIFLFPEDTSIINIEFMEDGYKMSFSGSTKNINRYYTEKKLNFGYLDFRDTYEIQLISNTEYNKVIEKADLITAGELSFLDNYESSNKLSRQFKNYERNEILYSGLLYKIQGSDRYSTFSKRKRSFPSDYYDFLENVVANGQAIYSKIYLEFLDEYMAWKYPVEQDGKLNWQVQLKKSFETNMQNAENELTNQPLEIYKIHKFSQLIPYYSDTASIDSIARKYQITKYERLFRIAGTKDKDGPFSEKLMPGDTIPDHYVTDNQYNQVSIREFKNYYLILHFYTMSNDSSTTQISKLRDGLIKYEKDDRVKLLNICLGCDYDQWAKSSVITKSPGTNLSVKYGWEEYLRKWFAIKGMPHFAILDIGNVLYYNVGASAEPANHIDLLLNKSTELP